MTVRQRSARDSLAARLGDLALVNLESLLTGTSDRQRRDLLAAYIEDLEEALNAARAQLRKLNERLKGGDPLVILEMPSRQRAADGAAAVDELDQRLAARADTCRDMARLSELVRRVLPRLAEADRLHQG
jgi:hypothetical protein